MSALIITIPIYIILYRYVPEIKLSIANTYHFQLEYLLTFLILLGLIWWLVSLIRKILFGIALAGLIVLGINLFRNQYSFIDVYNDYRSLVFYLIEEPVNVPFLPESANFKDSERILKAIDYTVPEVRNMAIVLSMRHFTDDYYYRKYGNVVRYFSVFKEMKDRWNYVPDPVYEEYFAHASETIHHFSGDCDDYSILMAALIHSIGGEVRLVRTIGHIYPEVKVCHRRDFEQINLLIRDLFPDETNNKSIFFHADNEGYIWLNFDYTDSYPGGKFMNIKIIDILEV